MKTLSQNDPGEMTIYDLWGPLMKRKMLIIGLFAVFVAFAAIFSPFLPKIYMGEAVLLVPEESGVSAPDIVGLIGKIQDEKKSRIFPTTNASICKITIDSFKRAEDKIMLSIESKDPGTIQAAVSELIVYINAIDIVRKNLSDEQEQMQKRTSELSAMISTASELYAAYKKQLAEGKVIGFNLLQMSEEISDMKHIKFKIEQDMARISNGIMLANQLYIENRPVKPRIQMIVALAGAVGLLTGILTALFLDHLKKMDKGPDPK